MLYKNLVQTGLISLNRLVEALTIAPAKILDLPGGVLEVGKAADLTIIDLEKETLFSVENILSKSKNTPWLNQFLLKRKTICNGNVTYMDSEKWTN